MPDDEFDNAYKIIKATHSDSYLLHTVEKTYGSQLKKLENLPKELLEKLVNKDSKNNLKKPASIPTLSKEQVEFNIRNTSPNAVGSVMRPDFQNVEKKSKIFSDLVYDFSLDEIKIKKKINNHETLSLVGNTFDKSFGTNYTCKKNKYSLWQTGLEYQPVNGSVKLSTKYILGKQSYKVELCKDKDSNSGIRLGGSYDFGNNKRVSLNATAFHNSGSAVKLQYTHKKIMAIN